MGNGPLCSGCALEKIGQGFTEVEIGKRYQQTKLLLVGEASGKSELADSLPFRPYGQSGSLLMDALRESSIDRGDVAITNIIRCRPLNDQLEKMWYQYGAINHCTTSYLIDVIKELKPNVILALGGTAFRTLTTPIAGKSGMLDVIRGYTLMGAGAAEGIPVIPTYHPSHLRRGAPELFPLLQRDLRRAFLMAIGRLVEGVHYVIDPLSHKGRYQTAPSLSEAWEWFRNIDPERSIYADIETPRSRRQDEDDRNSFADRDINLIQFSQRRGEGIALPWRDDYVEVAKAILGGNNRKVGHNWFGFDLPVLAANGITVNGEQDDTMILWKHFQPDLPANLQTVAQYCGFPFAWKHLADSEPEFYGAIDVDATCWADETLRALLEKEGRLGSYKTLFQQFWPILRDMSRRGLPVSEERRDNLREVIKVEGEKTDEAIKALIPVEVLGQKQKNGYKDPPLLKCDDCGEKFRTDHFCQQEQLDEDEQTIAVSVFVPYSDLAEANGLVQREVTITEEQKCRCKKAERSGCSVCAGSGIIPQGLVELRWMALTEFNPNSSHQVKRWMKFKRYPIPKHAKRTDASGEAAETTEVKELERLAAKTKDPVFPLLIQKRQLTKISGTYVEGWAADRDGRVRSTFTFGPATLQTASREPNVQNGLKHGKTPFQKTLAKAFNGMQCAEPGHVMVNIDAKSFHAQTTACEAGLADYLRLAKIDIHSFVTCHYLRMPERIGLYERPDEEMKEIFKKLKKDEGFKFTRDYKAKRCIAEGELVLTDQGLVPIQNVTIAMRVWDGVDWVNHEGLIYQGEREVITYDGLTATPDHEVFTHTGKALPFWKAASQMERLHRTGNQGIPLQSPHRDFIEATARRRKAESADEVRGVWKDSDEGLSHDNATTSWMPSLRSNEVKTSGSVGAQIRRDCFAMFLSSQSQVSSLRRTWDNLQVREPECICSVRGEGASAQGLQGAGDRQNKQRWPLRAGKFEISHTRTADAESQQYSLDTDCEWSSSTSRLGLSLRQSMDVYAEQEKGNDWRTDHRARQGSRLQGKGQNMAETSRVVRIARTYDLLNAGPRRCFTVSDCLVFNCILGIQFSMGPKKLFMLNPDDFDSEKEARVIHELIMKELFPGLAVWQEAVKKEAQEKKFLLNKYGAIRRFHDVVRYDRNRGKWVGGDQAESAVAFLPASSAFGYMRAAMSRIREKGWDEKYQLVNSIHDSLVLHCPKPLMEECIHNLTEEISKPSEVLVYPIVPNGLSVEAEASFGPDLANMEEWKG